MDETIETVKVIRPEAPGGHVVINKADMKPGDVLFEEKERGASQRRKRSHEREKI